MVRPCRALGNDRPAVAEAFDAGEFEVAATMVIELAPVTADELSQFAELAASFTGTDAVVAHGVIEIARARLAAA